MPIDIQRFSEYRPNDSITLLGNVYIAKDYQSPFSFSSWLGSFKQFNETPEVYIDSYRRYLSEWYKIKNNIILTNEETIILSYITIFYDLKLTYFTQEEKRFLTTLDYNSKQDIDIAIPFFARKIKAICRNLSDLRENVKAQPVKLNLGGTKETLQNILFDTIYVSYNDTELKTEFYKSDIDGTYILNNTRVLIEDLYDDTDYYKLSGYSQQVEIESDLFLNFTNAIINELENVEYIVPELSKYLTYTPTPNPNNLTVLYNKDYINTINDGLSSNLNLVNYKNLVEKFAGTNFYYLSTNSLSQSVTGILFETNSDSANDQNIFNIKFAIKQSTENLYTAKDVGGFYLPQRIGLLYYNPIKSSFSLNTQSLPPNSVIIFPDPAVYPYSTSGQISFVYNTTIFKHTLSDQYIYGDIKNDEKLPDFKGYQSLNQSLESDFNNVSKPSDSVSFFKSNKNNIWLNPDVYSTAGSAVYPVSARQLKLLVDNNADIIKFRTDVYGNSYALFKSVYKTENIQPKYELTYICNHFDGFYLNWPRYSQLDFNYTATTPEIADYIRTGQIANTFDQLSSVNYYQFNPLTKLIDVNEIPMFALSGSYYYVFGGSFIDKYCNTIDNPIYVGTRTYDGYTFINEYNSKKLYETPSTDSPLWPGNISNILNLYYQVLVEGGVNNYALRPTFTQPPTFKPAALSGTGWTFTTENKIIEGGTFLYVTVENGKVVNYNPFALRANDFYSQGAPYYNNTLSSATTQYSYISGLSSNEDIYTKRNITLGDVYVRTGNNTIISNIDTALSANFVRFPIAVRDEIQNNLIDFDVIYDTLLIKTTNYRVIDRINYDYNTNKFIGNFLPAIYISRNQNDLSINKFGDYFYNEDYKNLLFFNTTLSNSVSGNLKIIYPVVYKFGLADYDFKQIYPNPDTNLTQFSITNYLSGYYTDGLVDNYQYIFNPQNCDEPTVTYNEVTDIYTMVTKVYDNAGAYCIQELQFRFIGGTFTLLTNKCYFGDELIRDESYANSVSSTFLDYITPQVGLNIGTWDQTAGLYKF